MTQADSPTPAASPTVERFCPTCGRRTPAVQCPTDGAQTIQLRGFGRDPRNYKPDDLIAGRYRVTGVLGSGGMAAVYAAEHTSTHQNVAIKLMAAELGDDGDVAMRRFFREARVTSTLQHPNTVRVFDVGQDEQGPLYMAMELISGPTLLAELRDRIAQNRLMSQALVCDIGIQILDSLIEAHDHQLVHRDLKPANLILMTTEDGHPHVKVLDFGIARTLDSSLTATGAAPGTPAYMSPEQCKGEQVDGRSDLYSLAIILFVCVTGRLPFDFKDPMRVMQAHVTTPPPDPRPLSTAELSDDFVQVLLRGLAKKPVERFSGAVAMRAALVAVAAGQALPEDVGEPAVLADDSTQAFAVGGPAQGGQSARRMPSEMVSALIVAAVPLGGGGSNASVVAPISTVSPPAPGASGVLADVTPQLAAAPGSALSGATSTVAPTSAATAGQAPAWAPRAAIALVAVAAVAAAAVVWWPKPPPPAAVSPKTDSTAAVDPVADLVSKARQRQSADPRGALKLAEAALAIDPANTQARELVDQLSKSTRPTAATTAADTAATTPTAPIGPATAGTPSPAAVSAGPRVSAPKPSGAPKVDAAKPSTAAAKPKSAKPTLGPALMD